MSLLSLLSKFKPSTRAKETLEVAKSFPLIQQFQEATHGRIVDLIVGRPYNSIRSWLKKKLEKRLPGLVDTFLPTWTETKTLEEITGGDILGKSSESEKVPEATSPVSEVEKAYGDAEKDEGGEHTSNIAKEFETVSNQYRKDAGLQMVKPDDALNKLAAEVCEFQVKNRAVEHTPEGYRKQHNIGGEIITSGFSSATDALQKFVNSKEHYLALMGSFGSMGYAIRRGVEKKTGQTMYYLVVLYKNGKALTNENEVQKKEVPNKSPSPSLGSLPEYFQKTPALKKYFDALDLQIGHEKSPVTYALDLEKTQKEPSSTGEFWITLSKGEKKYSYLVSICPILFYQHSMTFEGLKWRGVPFQDVLKDLERADAPVLAAVTNAPQTSEPVQPASLPEKQKEIKAVSPAPTIEQLVQQAEPSAKASRTPSIEDLKMAAEKISALGAMPEPEKTKPKEPEIMGLS